MIWRVTLFVCFISKTAGHRESAIFSLDNPGQMCTRDASAIPRVVHCPTIENMGIALSPNLCQSGVVVQSGGVLVA